MGSEYSCCDRSFNLSIRVLGSVILIIFSHWNLLIFSLLSLAIWLASVTPKSYVQLEEAVPAWSFPLALTALAASMSVNALVTGLIAFRIYKVFQQVKPTSDEKTLGATGGRRLFSIISIIIESGMVLFSIQLAEFVVLIMATDSANYVKYWRWHIAINANCVYEIITCIHEVFNVIMRLVMSTPYFY